VASDGAAGAVRTAPPATAYGATYDIGKTRGAWRDSAGMTSLSNCRGPPLHLTTNLWTRGATATGGHATCTYHRTTGAASRARTAYTTAHRILGGQRGCWRAGRIDGGMAGNTGHQRRQNGALACGVALV